MRLFIETVEVDGSYMQIDPRFSRWYRGTRKNGDNTMDAQVIKEVKHPAPEAVSSEFRTVPLSRVKPSRENPRKYFSEEGITETAESLKTQGQMAPIPVTLVGDEDPDFDYEAIDGGRRYRSAVKAKLENVDVLVRLKPFKDDLERHLFALAANYSREALIPMDLSDALAKQVRENGFSQEQLAKHMGMKQKTVSDMLTLQNLHPKAQERLHPECPRNEELAVTTAVLLSKVPLGKQLEVLEKASGLSGRITTARVERAISELGIEVQARKRKRASYDIRRAINTRLNNALQGLRDVLRGQDADHIREFFDSLPEEDRAAALEDLDDADEVLGLIRSTGTLSAAARLQEPSEKSSSKYNTTAKRELAKKNPTPQSEVDDLEMPRKEVKDPTFLKKNGDPDLPMYFPLEVLVLLETNMTTRD